MSDKQKIIKVLDQFQEYLRTSFDLANDFFPGEFDNVKITSFKYIDKLHKIIGN